MFDRTARRLMDPALNRMGRLLAERGYSANMVTLTGLALGLFAATLIALGYPGLALVPLVASRLADGLDGAVARASHSSDFGGYLDIAADFLFYGAIPLAFVIMDPANHGAAGAFLLAAFYFNGTTFLGYAILAEKNDMESREQGIKSLYYSNGLLEGTETIIFFILLCLFAGSFSMMAWIFGTLCFIGGALRLYAARQVFRG